MLKSSETTAPGRPFPPGQSGNPAGRPPGVSGIRRAILRALGRKRDGKRALDQLVEVLTAKALSGNLAAAKLLVEYAYGKPATVADAVTWAADRAVVLRDVLTAPGPGDLVIPSVSPVADQTGYAKWLREAGKRLDGPAETVPK